MPSLVRSPGLFDALSVNLTFPADKMPPGRWPRLTNVRSYTRRTVQSRPALKPVQAAALDQLFVHSIQLINDATPFNLGVTSLRFIGSGTKLYSGAALAGPYAVIDTGYSGSPLSMVAATPAQSPQPWIYIADANKMVKVNVAGGTPANIGIAQPTAPPTAVLGQATLQAIDDMEALGAWVAAGTVANAPALTANGRVNTTITAILYDAGVLNSYALIAPASMAGIGVGSRLVLGAVAETVLVTDVKIAVATTTIAAIIYDAGTTGLCTIQPTASLGTGQLQGPDIGAVRSRAGYAPLGQQGVAPVPGQVPLTSGTIAVESPQIRQLDFPVDCMIRLNSGGGTDEYVRVLSAAVGPDGIQSFRCVTVNNHVATDSITGIAAFRAYLTTTRVATDAIKKSFIRNTLTPPTVAPMTGGMKIVAAKNLALIGTRATLPDDQIHLSIRINNLTDVTEIRVYFDVDAATNDFTQNYYFKAFDAHALASSVNASATLANIQPVINSQLLYLINGQLQPLPPGRSPEGLTSVNPSVLPGSGTLALGNNQWVELRFRVKELLHVGTDPSRTLANVAAMEIVVAAKGNYTLTVDYDALWLSGTYGADVGDLGFPYVWCYRYRSSTTGARSNPSPAMRGGVPARRQRIALAATLSTDAQVDKIDYFRHGGSLTQWQYVGTGPNTGTGALNDDYGDKQIAGSEGLAFDTFQPFPTQDLPRRGTCNVAGSAVSWVTGDKFDERWMPGIQIKINGIAYTLYATPSGAGPAPSGTFLQLNENAGALTAATFEIDRPFILAQPLPYWFGPYDAGGQIGQFLFAVGDPTNPGQLNWTTGNDPDATSDKNILDVTTPSSPLQHGCIYDQRPFVFSTDELYLIEFDPSRKTFRASKTPCGKGLWTHWAFWVAKEGIYFLAKDGIYLTVNGSPAVSITDEDLYPLFPHDQVPGVAVNGYNPPDMTLTTKLRLGGSGKKLYFDYVDTAGANQTLVYDTLTKGWLFDHYEQGGATVHVEDPGAGVNNTLVGGFDGRFYTYSGTQDNGVSFTCTVRTKSDDSGDSRSLKLYEDMMIDLDTQGVSVNVLAGLDNFGRTLALAKPIIQTGRDVVGVNLSSGAGVQARNLGLEFTWTDKSVVTLYEWQPLGIHDALDMLRSVWQTKASALGLPGYKHFRDGYIAYASTVEVKVTLYVDNIAYVASPNVLPSTNGVYTKAYVVFPAVKGKIFSIFVSATAGFELFVKDLEFRVRPWSQGGPYATPNPFLESYSGAVA